MPHQLVGEVSRDVAESRTSSWRAPARSRAAPQACCPKYSRPLGADAASRSGSVPAPSSGNRPGRRTRPAARRRLAGRPRRRGDHRAMTRRRRPRVAPHPLHLDGRTRDRKDGRRVSLAWRGRDRRRSRPCERLWRRYRSPSSPDGCRTGRASRGPDNGRSDATAPTCRYILGGRIRRRRDAGRTGQPGARGTARRRAHFPAARGVHGAGERLRSRDLRAGRAPTPRAGGSAGREKLDWAEPLDAGARLETPPWAKWFVGRQAERLAQLPRPPCRRRPRRPGRLSTGRARTASARDDHLRRAARR